VPCPSKCADGSKPKLYSAKSAYAVAKPADVEGIQREIMAHGSIEVGFQVFSDFMNYHNGTYQRTAASGSLKGGHVRRMMLFSQEIHPAKGWPSRIAKRHANTPCSFVG